MEFDFSSDRPKRGPPARFASRMGDQAGKPSSIQSTESVSSQAQSSSLVELGMVISTIES